MRRLLKMLIVCATAVLFQNSISHQTSAAEVTRQVTSGGQIYWHYPVENAKCTAVAINWPTGVSMLPKGQEMAARIGINLILNDGADGKTSDEIIAGFSDLDAYARLFVQPEEIRGFVVTPDAELMKAAIIANQVLARPNLSADWFRRERNKLAGKSRGRDKLVPGIGWNLSREILMPDHRYKNFWSIRPALNIDATTLETIKNWQSTAFRSDDITVVVTGSSDFARIGAAIDRALEGLPKGKSVPVTRLPELVVPAKIIIFHAPQAAKSMILTFGKVPPASANQDLPLNISLGVLGYGQQSRLFKAVRTGLRAAYGFGSGYINYTRNQRLFRMSGEVETTKLQEALVSVRNAYDAFRVDGIGLIEFPLARRIYRQRIEALLNEPSDASHLLMEGRLNGAPDDNLTTMLERIENLERSKVNDFIKKTFLPFDQLLTIVVTPDADAVKGDCVITAYEQWRTCF